MTRPLQPVMPDERMDRLVRELLNERAEDVAATALSANAMADRVSARLHPAARGRWVVLAAAATLAVLLIGGALALASGLVKLPSTLPINPSPSESAQPTRSLSSLPTPVPGVAVYGWPDRDSNGAGLYSWDGARCGKVARYDSCAADALGGWMHNGYGSGNLEIVLALMSGRGIPDSGVTPATVAGFDGVYRRIDSRHEEWIVYVEGTTISIRLNTGTGTSEAELAEAHAIVDSMRLEARDNVYGFRLLFTLTTDDWDSG